MEGRIVDETQPEIPRSKRPNPYEYTELDFAKKDLAVRDMLRDHPTIPEKWLSWLYDVIEHKSPDEVADIINNNKWDMPLNKDREKGGTIIGACEVLPPPNTLIE